MRVSVVTPTYNRASTVGNAVESVLSQTYQDFEHFVVDDGSTDGTQKVLASFDDKRLTCLWQPNRGQSAARNRAIAEATGDVVAFLDSDDTWCDTKLEEQVDLMQRYPEVGVLFGDRLDVTETGSVRRYVGLAETPCDLTETLLHGNVVNFNSSMVRTSILREYPFDEDMRAGEDFDLWLRLAPKTLFLFNARPWLHYSVAAGRISEAYEPVFENNARSIQRLIDSGEVQLSRDLVSRTWSRFYARYGRHHAAAGRRREALVCCAKAIRFRPFSMMGWRALASAAVRRT